MVEGSLNNFSLMHGALSPSSRLVGMGVQCVCQVQQLAADFQRFIHNDRKHSREGLSAGVAAALLGCGETVPAKLRVVVRVNLTLSLVFVCSVTF